MLTSKLKWIGSEDVMEQICIADILKESKAISGKRLALILTDNAVEYIIKSFGDLLLIPNRVIARKEWEGRKQAGLNQAIEVVAPNCASSVEWTSVLQFHELRNKLYHSASPLSVESTLVSQYLAIAHNLLHQLFGIDIPDTEWTQRKKKVQLDLKLEREVEPVQFSETPMDNVSFSTKANVKETEAIQLVLSGFAKCHGSPPSFEQLSKSLMHSGHGMKDKSLRVKISQLRGRGMINQGQLVLTHKAREALERKFHV